MGGNGGAVIGKKSGAGMADQNWNERLIQHGIGAHQDNRRSGCSLRADALFGELPGKPLRWRVRPEFKVRIA
jgi:hypothetical protein